MTRFIICGLILICMVIPYSFSQEKIKTYRVHYYENYDFSTNRFTDKLNIQALPFTDKYYKVYYTYNNKLLKAEKMEYGQISIFLSFRPDRSLVFYLTYLYDKQDRVYRIETFNNKLKMLNYQIFYYDPNNNLLTKIIDYNTKNQSFGERKFSYLVNGKLKKERVYFRGQFLYEKNYEYDAQGNVIYRKPKIADPTVLDVKEANLNNPQHIEAILKEIAKNPDKANEILAKYGIDSQKEIDEFYLKAGKLEHANGIIKKIPRPKFGKYWAILDFDPEIVPFDAKTRNKEYQKQELIKIMDKVTLTLDELVKEHNRMQFAQTQQFVSKLTDFAIQMIALQQYMNECKLTEQQKKILTIFQTIYYNQLRNFLAATQEAREIFQYGQPFQSSMTKQLRDINAKINRFIKVHNFLVFEINKN